LKILLTPETVLQEQNVLEPIEVVALINSIGKLSSAITAIDVLSRQSWEDDYFATSKILVQKKEKEEQEEQEERKKRSSGSGSGGSRTGSMSESDRGTVEKSIASLTNKIEEVLVLQEQQQAVNRNANVVDRFDYADVGLQVVEKLSRSSLVVLQEKEENVCDGECAKAIEWGFFLPCGHRYCVECMKYRVKSGFLTCCMCDSVRIPADVMDFCKISEMKVE
jgi:hypothetical protein